MFVCVSARPNEYRLNFISSWMNNKNIYVGKKYYNKNRLQQQCEPMHGKKRQKACLNTRQINDEGMIFWFRWHFAPQKKKIKKISACRLDQFYFLVIHLLSPIKCRQTFVQSFSSVCSQLVFLCRCVTCDCSKLKMVFGVRSSRNYQNGNEKYFLDVPIRCFPKMFRFDGVWS